MLGILSRRPDMLPDITARQNTSGQYFQGRSTLVDISLLLSVSICV